MTTPDSVASRTDETVFDYPTPTWVEEDANMAIELPVLGAFAGSLADVSASIYQSGQVLPRRSDNGTDYQYWDLLFLQRYVFTHMLLMKDSGDLVVSVEDPGGEMVEVSPPEGMVLVHDTWMLAVQDVFLSMSVAIQVGVGVVPGPHKTVQRWVHDLEEMARWAARIVDYLEEPDES